MTSVLHQAEETTETVALLDTRMPGHALPGPCYTSPAFFDVDVAAVWASTWIFVGTEAEVREPGDFFTVDIGPYSVIVLRDDDEDVRALHNVCRHRGSRLLTDRAGSIGNIVCGYHQWTYATDGSLLHAGDQAPGFDKSCFGLRPVHLRVVDGLLFISLANDPPDDFDQMATAVSPYVQPYQLRRTKVAAQVDLVEAANWKLVMENNRECYHCEAGHPELMQTFFPTYGYEPDRDPGAASPRARALPPGRSSVGGGLRAAWSPVRRDRRARHPRQRLPDPARTARRCGGVLHRRRDGCLAPPSG